jgi:hypothetical protein
VFQNQEKVEKSKTVFKEEFEKLENAHSER